MLFFNIYPILRLYIAPIIGQSFFLPWLPDYSTGYHDYMIIVLVNMVTELLHWFSWLPDCCTGYVVIELLPDYGHGYLISVLVT